MPPSTPTSPTSPPSCPAAASALAKPSPSSGLKSTSKPAPSSASPAKACSADAPSPMRTASPPPTQLGHRSPPRQAGRLHPRGRPHLRRHHRRLPRPIQRLPIPARSRPLSAAQPAAPRSDAPSPSRLRLVSPESRSEPIESMRYSVSQVRFPLEPCPVQLATDLVNNGLAGRHTSEREPNATYTVAGPSGAWFPFGATDHGPARPARTPVDAPRHVGASGLDPADVPGTPVALRRCLVQRALHAPA